MDKNISVYQYNLFMKETLASYKYRGDAVIAEFFAPKLYDLYMKHFRGYVVIPIPLSPQRLIERGFNQSELLLTGWKNATIHPVLQRKEREKQSKKSRRLRLASFDDNPFSIKKELNNISQKLNKAILIDDIYTTGTTLRQAAYVLKQIGVEEVVSLTIAR
ncbi:ComF family protein [Alkalihalobacillus pseudalcaliphilus]|uniref:ComF family protein n=1 Tax=Alkalihalobacillus pseudalcaliphilus TaxID=79884 RepID=UPI002361569D|nr:hypothetical protein [Alkalihalobacillus pseudalcaliphilus]